jgi:Flp pilus assembly protein TadG
MTTKTLIERLRGALRALRTARGGNVAFTFALATVPIMGFTGSAVDYSRANSAKAAMQAAVDATALMLSKNVSTLTTSQINQQATNYFNALFNRTDVTNIAITPAYTTSGGSQIVVTGTGTVATTFMKVMGFSTLDIGVSSTVKWGNSRLRVALVLDNTGSMATSNKMTALKTAAKSLLTQLQNAASQNGDVYVSIVPFSKDVNVDPVNYNQSWVRWDLWDAANGSSSSSTSFSGSICYNGTLWQVNGSSWTNGGSCTGTGGGICYNGTLWTWNGSTFISGGSCGNHSTWNGCVTDRDQNNDTTNTAPVAGTQATLFPAEQYSNCPVPLMALSYDWTALRTKIDAMQPDGLTNQAIGLQWGWQTLTAAPFTIPAKDPNYTYQEVIILLTDGLNTQDRWYSNQSQIDARQQITCNNVKAAGITLYTVQVNTDGDPTSTLLQNCASDSSKFFLLTSSSAIVTTFNQIATQLSNLRVAR